jgi:hypothetical protein
MAKITPNSAKLDFEIHSWLGGSKPGGLSGLVFEHRDRSKA